jgi:hypothetical protein
MRGGNLQVTTMLLLVSTVFLLFNIPSHAVRVYLLFESSIDPQYQPGRLLVLVQKLTMHLFNASFATNFVLYSASGRAFRRATVRLAKTIGHRTTSWICRLIHGGRRTVTMRPLAEWGRLGRGYACNDDVRQADNEPRENGYAVRTAPAAAVYATATPGAQPKTAGGNGFAGGGFEQARRLVGPDNPYN